MTSIFHQSVEAKEDPQADVKARNAHLPYGDVKVVWTYGIVEQLGILEYTTACHKPGMVCLQHGQRTDLHRIPCSFIWGCLELVCSYCAVEAAVTS